MLLFLLIFVSLVFLTGCAKETQELEWKCSMVECAEIIDMTGQEWAQENCFDVDGELICRLVFDNGDIYEAPLNELDLSQISATRCAQFVCV